MRTTWSDDARLPWRNARVAGNRRMAVLAIALIVCVGFALRVAQLGADPWRQISASNAELTDGSWYLAEVVDAHGDRPIGVAKNYRRPLFTWLARPFFSGGSSLERAHLMAACYSTLLIVFAAGACWVAYGPRSAVLAALLLASSCTLVAYGRTPVVYGPLATLLAALAWLVACAGHRRWLLIPCWGGLVALVLLLKTHALALAPALAFVTISAVFKGLRRLSRAQTLSVVGGLAALVCVGAGLAWGGRWEWARGEVMRAVSYFGDAHPLAILKRMLRAPFASTLFVNELGVAALAWLGMGAALASRSGDDEDVSKRNYDLFLTVWLCAWLGLFGLFHFNEGAYTNDGPPPLRYFIPALIPTCLLAARWLCAAYLRAPSTLAVRMLWGFGGCYVLSGSVLSIVASKSVPQRLHALVLPVVQHLGSFVGLVALASLFVCALELLRGRWVLRLPLRRFALAMAVILVAWGGGRTISYLSRPTFELREANAFVAALLGTRAAAMGTWAHAFTYSHRLDARTLPPPQMAAWPDVKHTHLIIEQGWMHEVDKFYRSRRSPWVPPDADPRPVKLIPIASIPIRGHAINVYRYPWAETLGYKVTDLEGALESRVRQ